MDTVTINRERLRETVIQNRRLGRHVNHDSRSRLYRVAPSKALNSVVHNRMTPVLDQGNLGSCTGNAAVGVLGTNPFFTTMPTGQDLTESEAIKVYSLGTQLDSYASTYPPDDTGSDGLSVAKACQQLGLISGYTHAFSMDDFLAGMQKAPAITGTTWLTGMDSPDANGLVTFSGSVRGGHEFEANEIDMTNEIVWFYNSWGTGFGRSGRFGMRFTEYEKALADGGDATFFVPKSQPAPTPTPTPGAAPFPGATDAVAKRITTATSHAHMSTADWLNHHFSKYFNM